MEPVTDQDLLRRARLLEEQALAEIYDRWSPGLYRYALRLMGDADLAEECVSDTFRRFLEIVKNGRGPRDYLQAYLYRTAHNWVTDQYRRNPVLFVPLGTNLAIEEGEEPPKAVDRNI